MRQMEPLVVWALIGVAVVVLLRRSRGASTVLMTSALILGTAAGQALWAARSTRRQQSREALAATAPQPASDGGYVTSDSCRACHPSEYASWHRSYHRT